MLLLLCLSEKPSDDVSWKGHAGWNIIQNRAVCIIQKTPIGRRDRDGDQHIGLHANNACSKLPTVWESR